MIYSEERAKFWIGQIIKEEGKEELNKMMEYLPVLAYNLDLWYEVEE